MYTEGFYPSAYYYDANKVQLLSRTGTESNSSSKPCTLTFNFAPRIVINIGRSSSTKKFYSDAQWYSNVLPNGGVWLGNVTTSYTSMVCMDHDDNSNNIKKSSDGKTIYWYGSYAWSALDANSFIYYFLGIS